MKTIRRSFSIFLVLCFAALPLLFAQAPDKSTAKKNYLAFVGTYTSKTASKGIYAFRYDANSGKLSPIGVAAETQDPSWIAIYPDGKFLYAVNEAGKDSSVSSFAVDAKKGKLTPVNQMYALGEDPCYISLDKKGWYVLTANYTSGNVAVFPLTVDGFLDEHSSLVIDKGASGPNKGRQDGPHAHWIETSADDRYAYVSDLGLDRILIYKFDSAKGILSVPDGKQQDSSSLTLPPGSGPRHLALSHDGKVMYVLGELQSTVAVFVSDTRGKFHLLQTISSLPQGYSGRNDAAEIAIHPNGRFLYASNRGHDSIAAFHIDPASGKLTPAGDYSVLGKEPRHFAIDPSGNFLLAEDQLSDKIVTFRIDQKTGALTPTGDSVEVPSPVCLVFLPVD